MGTMQFPCAVCGKMLEAEDSATGKRVICPACSGLTVVPEREGEAELLAPAPAAVPSAPPPAAAPQAAAPRPAAAAGVALTRLCPHCGATTCLDAACVAREAHCSACRAPLPPSPSETVRDIAYPDRPNLLAQSVSWGVSVALHTLLFLSLTAVSVLPTRREGTEHGPVAIAEEADRPAVSPRAPEPVDVQAQSELADLAAEPKEVELPAPEFTSSQMESDAALTRGLGTGDKKAAQMPALPVIRGGRGGPVLRPRTGGPGGGRLSGKGFVGRPGDDPGGRGELAFTLTWSWTGSSRREGPDIDMWVRDPRGQTLSTSRNGFSLGPTPQGGRIDFDDLGGWGDGNGGGPERTFWPKGKTPTGKYTYGVRYYQGNGTASYTLRVYRGKKLDRMKRGTLRARGRPLKLGTVDTH